MFALQPLCPPASRSDRRHALRLVVTVRATLAMLFMVATTMVGRSGEPAADFLAQLRAAGYFDTAIAYLDRLDQYPGVDEELIRAVLLEKAQTFIDAGVGSTNAATRDQMFSSAEDELRKFLNAGSHPRVGEARLQLGRLQMVRAAQLLLAEADETKRQSARDAYAAAARTFDEVVAVLREKLSEMKGARIDAKQNPELVALRDQYRGEFLEAMMKSGEARLLAARTYENPASQGKSMLQEAERILTDLSKKYGGYVQGAIALAHRGHVQSELGMTDQAVDSYLRMLEQTDAEPLRDAKHQATAGLIRVWMRQSPPEFDRAIERGQAMVDDIRPNEKSLASVQTLSFELAKAYLAKAESEGADSPTALRRAKSNGRQLLVDLSRTPGAHQRESAELLSGLGIELAENGDEPLPTAADPASLDEALENARQLLDKSENLSQTLALLDRNPNQTDQVQQQAAELEKQMNEARAIAVVLLRRGLALVRDDTDIENTNQARRYLSYLLYLDGRYRESAVVGQFLARVSPGTETGLQGGLLALNSMQQLLAADLSNEGLANQLQALGEYLTNVWPNDPKAASAKGVMVKLALSNDRFDEAEAHIEKLEQGRERSSFLRLLGRAKYVYSQRDDAAEADLPLLLSQAAEELESGLSEVQSGQADVEIMRSALALSKIQLQLGRSDEAMDVMDHPVYGPVTLLASLGAPDDAFETDLYRTELQVVVQKMTSDDKNTQKLLDRALQVIEKLQQSVSGPDAKRRLSGIYIRMAQEIKEQLGRAAPAKRAKLVEAFRIFLERVAGTTTDSQTLLWSARTLIELAESSMGPNDIRAQGQAADLLKTAAATFERVGGDAESPMTVDFQLARTNRLLGNYKQAIDTLEKVLRDKPTMLDAQMEAALAYEQWAGIVAPKFKGRAYGSALNGARPGPNGQNAIWGWGRISTMASRDPRFKDTFFKARYHVALCRFLQGQAIKDRRVIEKSETDIMRVHALYPKMGGQERKTQFDQLLRTVQKELGKQASGLPNTEP